MNKKIKIIILAVLIPLLAAGGWFAYVFYGPKPSMEEMLPAEAVIYTRLAHPAKHWQKGAESEFWKNIAAIDIPNVLTRNKVSQEKIIQFVHAQRVTTEFFKNPLIQKFLDKEIAFVMYPDKQMILVLRLAPSVQAAEFVGRMSDQWGDEVVVTEDQYEGERIVHVRLTKKDTRIKYVRLRDLLFISMENETGINKVIDTYHHKQTSLKQDPNFMLVQSRAYPGAEGLVYISKEGLTEMITEDMGSALFNTIGFTTYGVSFLPGPVSKYKFIVSYKDTQSMAPSLRWMVSCEQHENSSLGLVPFDSLGYHWSGCYDFKELWQQAKEQLRDLPEEKYGDIEKVMNKKEYADLIPALGNQAGFYLTDVDTHGLFPYPRFLAFIKITERAQAEESLKRIFKSPLGLIQEEDYAQVNIKYMGIPLGPNMDPGYCFVGDYLLVSSSRQLLKKSIDTFQDPNRSLTTDQAFIDFGMGGGSKIRSLMFLKVGDIAHRLRELLDWGNKYLSSQVSMVSAYRQENQAKKKELGEGSQAKEEELKLAQAKLLELQADMDPAMPIEDAADLAASIDHLNREIQDIRNSIKTYAAQQVELTNMMARYDLQVDSAKLFMFNSQNVLVPVINSLESINAQGLTMTATDRLIETELMMN